MRITLGDHIVEINERTTTNNQHRVLTSSQKGIVSQDEYFNKQIASKENTGYKIVKRGQFTYRAMSDTGKFYINRLMEYDVGIVSPAYPVFEVIEDNIIYTPYIVLFFESDYFQSLIVNQSTGSTRVSLKLDKIKRISIDIPSYQEQKEIVEKIESVKRAIAARDEQLSCFNELVKSRFIELFGDLKSNPHNWQYKNLLDVADIDTVMVSDYEKYADYPHIGIDSIEKNTGRLFGYRTIAEDGVISGKYLFTARHIIYSKIRPNLNKVALPDFDGLCSADAYPILPKENVCLRIYLGYVMRSEFFLDYILPFSRRANMPKVNKEQLSGFNLPVPDIELQRQFAAFVEQTDKSKLAVQKALEELEILKKSLMQQYFG